MSSTSGSQSFPSSTQFSVPGGSSSQSPGSSGTQSLPGGGGAGGGGSTPGAQGAQGARALPQTGIDPGFLLMLGGALVVSGVLVLRYSNDPT